MARPIPTWRNVSTAGIQEATQSLADANRQVSQDVGGALGGIADIAQQREDFRTEEVVNAVEALKGSEGELTDAERAQFSPEAVDELNQGTIFGARQSDINEALQSKAQELRDDYLKEAAFQDKKTEIKDKPVLDAFAADIQDLDGKSLEDRKNQLQSQFDSGKISAATLRAGMELADQREVTNLNRKAAQIDFNIKSLNYQDEVAVRAIGDDWAKEVNNLNQLEQNNVNVLKNVAQELNAQVASGVESLQGAEFSYDPNTKQVLVNGAPASGEMARQIDQMSVEGGVQRIPTVRELANNFMQSQGESGDPRILNEFAQTLDNHLTNLTDTRLSANQEADLQETVTNARVQAAAPLASAEAELDILNNLTGSIEYIENETEYLERIAEFGATYDMEADDLGAIAQEIAASEGISYKLVYQAMLGSVDELRKGEEYSIFDNIDEKMWRTNAKSLRDKYQAMLDKGEADGRSLDERRNELASSISEMRTNTPAAVQSAGKEARKQWYGREKVTDPETRTRAGNTAFDRQEAAQAGANPYTQPDPKEAAEAVVTALKSTGSSKSPTADQIDAALEIAREDAGNLLNSPQFNLKREEREYIQAVEEMKQHAIATQAKTDNPSFFTSVLEGNRGHKLTDEEVAANKKIISSYVAQVKDRL